MSPTRRNSGEKNQTTGHKWHNFSIAAALQQQQHCSSSSIAAAAALQQQQHCSSSSSIAAAVQQHCSSSAAALQQQQHCSSSIAAAAAALQQQQQHCSSSSNLARMNSTTAQGQRKQMPWISRRRGDPGQAHMQCKSISRVSRLE